MNQAHGYDPDDEGSSKRRGEAPGGPFKDFDCPTCNANNPVDEGFGDGSEVRCYYCGLEFKVLAPEGGRPKFKEL